MVAVDKVEEDADEVEDDGNVDRDDDEEVLDTSFESTTKPRLCSCPLTKPLILEVLAVPVGSLMIKTKLALWEIWSSLMLSSSPIFQLYDPEFCTSAVLQQD